MPVILLARRKARRAAARVFLGAALLAAVPCLFGGTARAEEASPLIPEFWDVYGNLELEGTGFFDAPRFPGQRRDGLSVAVEATALAEWNDGDTVATAVGFYRFDGADDQRTHADLRELKIEHTEGDWSFGAGVDRVFWGKTEVVHLVDIINQTDQVEDLDDEDRLGQPLVRVSRLTDIGEFSLFYLPYARERTLPGREGRLRLAVPYVTNDHEFEPAAGQWAPSFAARFSGTFGAVDLGLSAFQGVSRDPAFRFEAGRLLPVYQRITQGGIDAQYTTGATLWKAEAILREGQRNLDFEVETYGALTGGLEHTLFGIAGMPWDLGLIVEGAWDSRGDAALTVFEGDVILGARLTLNDVGDTALLATASVDADSYETVFRLEGEHRFGERITASLEAQAFVNASNRFDDGFARDHFVRLKVKYFF